MTMQQTAPFGARAQAPSISGAQPSHAKPGVGPTPLEAFANVAPAAATAQQLAERLLRHLNIELHADRTQNRRIPKTGPVIFVCDQPFGTVESLALLSHVGEHRPDVGVFAHLLMSMFQPLRDQTYSVDPGFCLSSRVRNLLSFKDAMQAVAGGGAIGPLPTQGIAQFDDGPWQVVNPGVHSDGPDPFSSLIARSGATLIPVAFTGSGDCQQRFADLLDSPVEPPRRQQACAEMGELRVEFGSAIRPSDLPRCRSAQQSTAWVRQRSRSLCLRPQDTCGVRGDRFADAPVAAAGPTDDIASEVARLPAQQVLVRHKKLLVAYARGAECPALLNELGRLRQLAFRAAGEGTAAVRDLDDFDSLYDHLFVWNTNKSEVVGAYRIGRLDPLGDTKPYTSTLFECSNKLFSALGPCLELGRSFVRVEYQRSASGLIMLWRGIGQYIARAPAYRNLLGPVSISAAYGAASQQAMVQYMEDHHADPRLTGLVRPKTPFDPAGDRHDLFQRYGDHWGDLASLNRWVSHLERDGKGIPVLVKSYLQLGGRMLGFNVDHGFGDCVDGLVVVDVARTPRATLNQLMGQGAAQTFLQRHGGA